MAATTDARHEDGRKARRVRGRQAVLDAAIRLYLSEGTPTAERLAKEAGVSVSSLFRYFEGVDDVRRQVAATVYARHRTLIEAAPTEGASLDERITEFVELRIAVRDAFWPFAMRAQTEATENPQQRVITAHFRGQLTGQVERFFAPELDTRAPADRADISAALHAATSVAAYQVLAEVNDRSPAQIARAWTSLLAAVLTDGG